MNKKARPHTSDAAPAGLPADTPPPQRLPAGRWAQREPKPDRRTAILLAAEKLFALHGYHAVSIRDIAAEADVQLASVRYYYGAKHELYRAIFESWQGLIDQRLSLLRAATAEPARADRLERIVEAFVGPVLALHRSPEGQYFAMMAARDLTVPTSDTNDLEHEFFDPMARAFIDALVEACPGAERPAMAWCYQLALGAMLHFLMSAERAERLGGGTLGRDDPAAAALLVNFIATGIRGGVAAPHAARRVARPPTRS